MRHSIQFIASNNFIPFTITVDTTKAGSAADTFILPLSASASYDFNIEWGDGNDDDITVWNQAETTHVYSVGGIYQIKISGEFERIFFNDLGDKAKLITIDEWGSVLWSSMEDSFTGCSSLTGGFSDAPNLINATSVSFMFRNCVVFNENIGSWNISTITNASNWFFNATLFNNGGSSDIDNLDVSSITNFQNLFRLSAFNQPLSNWTPTSGINCDFIFSSCPFNQNIGAWDMSNFTDISNMFLTNTVFNNGGSDSIKDWDVSSVLTYISTFQGATAFNQPLLWVTTAATNMSSMFRGANIFNQSLTTFDLNGVTTTLRMFFQATAFDGDITNFDMSTVTVAKEMLHSCPNFDQDISGWDMSGKADLTSFLFGGSSFDQDLSSWDITDMTNATNMLNGVTLSTVNYDLLLVGWEGQVEKLNVPFHGGNSQYTLLSAADTARGVLISTSNWTITDGGGV